MACLAPQQQHNVDLVDILNRAANLTTNGSAAAFPEMAYSSPLMGGPVPSMVLSGTPSSPSSAAKSVPNKAGGKSALKTPVAKKRTWKKPKDKPKRPLSAYNIFFKEERQRLVSTHNDKAAAAPSIETVPTAAGTPKRRHRKSHGKIGFAALAQNIAAKWKSLDSDARGPFDAKASVEKTRYRKELDVWQRKEKAKKDVEKSQKKQLQLSLDTSNNAAPSTPTTPASSSAATAPAPAAVTPSPPTRPPMIGESDEASQSSSTATAVPLPSSMRTPSGPLDQQALAVFQSAGMNLEPVGFNKNGMGMQMPQQLPIPNDLLTLKSFMAASVGNNRPMLPLGFNGVPTMMQQQPTPPMMLNFPTAQQQMMMSLNNPAAMQPPMQMQPIPAPAAQQCPQLQVNTPQEKAWCDLEGLDDLDANLDELLSDANTDFDVQQDQEQHTTITEPPTQQQMPPLLFPTAATNTDDYKTHGILSSIDKLDSELDSEFLDFLSEEQ